MSSLPPDPYKILGVSKDAQIPEIRSAHRKLVLKCHPDKVQDPTLKAQKQDEFQKVQQAYELLSDDNERQKYDDKVKLDELRRQFQNKANISSPRSSPRYSGQDESRGPESRPSPFKARSSPAAETRTYAYNRSSDEDLGRGARIFEATPRMARREASYAGKSSKREVDRERERERERERDRDRERDARDREKERERDRERRRRQEDAIRRAEKEVKEAREAKEVRRAEKRQRDKQRDKEMKRAADEKKRHAKPYIEPFDDEPPVLRSEKKKSSSKKHDDKRDRSSGREETPTVVPSPPGPQRSWTTALNYAASYIEASRAKSGAPPVLKRAATYHSRSVQPPAPTPPPVPGQSAAFAAPDDDDVRRSSAKPRRGSGDGPRLSRERSYRASSREVLDDPNVVNVSPSSRYAAQFSKSGSGTPAMASSPPRGDLPRTNTMPMEPPSYSRAPGLGRAQTFNVFGDSDPRGRGRSRMQAQAEDSDSDEAYERMRDRTHWSNRRYHSPEPMRAENVSRYQVDGGRTRLHSSYSRRLDPGVSESYSYYPPGARVTEVRPTMPPRESSYSASAATSKFPKVKTAKAYGYDDVQYSNYYDKPHREEFAAAFA